ncbi:dynein regulatory complex protein 10-like [Saccoglossus kowalevskii]|uniref:Dynein regulatory complex protein 10 n=1 Tax=Saccoglossus kowalevskii TaxID=10224 RepID=A0ABM0GKT3_SACKO|nr:PREDICTED: IQ domain-containing protein D-like [Saccoglossus kowalevskii]
MTDFAVRETLHLLEKVRVDGTAKDKMEAVIYPTAGPAAGLPKIRREPKQKKHDALRVLDPSRKKLTTIESQRILAAYEESIKRVEVVTLLPFVAENLDRFNVVLGGELVTAIEEYAELQKAYQQLVAPSEPERPTSKSSKRSATQISRRTTPASHHSVPAEGELPTVEPPGSRRGTPNSYRSSAGLSGRSSAASDAPSETVDPEAEAEKARNIEILKQHIGFACKNILRLFSSNPAAVNAVRAERQARDIESNAVIGYLNELREIIFEKLLTTPHEETKKDDYLKEITVREKKNSEVIKKLEGELESANDEKDEEISKRNDVIRRLKADLHQIEKFSEEHIRRTKSEADKQQQADLRNSEGKQQRLQTDLSGLRTQLANMIAEHRETELTLRKRKYKVETEVENWIQKYDADMGERQDEYEEVDAVYTEEKAQLNELEERFKTLEEEYKTIVEERRIAQEKKEREERELQMMIKAATVIQSFWRSFRCRKQLKGKKKKGKKGKGKSGKKKKK